jgi:CxxC-x17-CxxC domain-containing protein
MSDQQITCSECGGVFVFTEAEQQFYETKGLAAPPKRCKACRQARRAAREGGAGPDNARGAGGGFGGAGGGFGGGAPRGGAGGGFGGRPGAAPRRFSNDANEYRAPMNGAGPGDRGPGGPPRAGGFNARGPRPARPGFGAGPSQGGAGFRGGNGNADARPTFNRPDERPRGNFNGPAGQGGQGEYRGPARDRGQWGTGGGPGQGPGANRAPAGNGGNDRPRRPERDFNAPRPERVVTPPSDDPRQTRPRAERPRFDITCAECGTQSQVPFKPLEGRQVFCQACYRARKGTNATETGAVETTEAPEADLGIVE